MAKARDFIIILIIPLIFFFLAIFTISDYGVSWDEPYHLRRGQAFLHFFLTGQKNYENLPKYPPLKGDSDSGDFRESQRYFIQVQENPSLSDPSFRRSYYQDDAWNGEYHIDIESPGGHPAANGILAALSNYVFYQKLGILGDLEAYQFFIIFTVSLATFAIAVFMYKNFGIIESIFSSLAFASYPLILGQQHFNIKDPVVASFYTLFIITAFIGLTKKKAYWLLAASIFFGLGLATKFNIIFSLPVILIWFVLKRQPFTKRTVITLIAGTIIVLGIFFASFPTIWQSPFNGFLEITKYYLEVGYPKEASLTQSSLFSSYPILWIIYTTPPVLLILILVFLIFAKKIIQKNSFSLLLLLWLSITVARNSFFGALNYGGARLFMEFIPPLAMLGGITAGHLIKLFTNKKYSVAVFILISLAFVPTLAKLAKIHPNEAVYFNFLAGGLAGAKEKSLPSWGDSYGNAYYPALVWLNENAEPEAKLSLPVANTSNIPRFKLRPDIAVSPNYWSGLKHKGEYLIELTYDYEPMNWFSLKYLNEAMIPIYEVKIDGIAIAKVWKNETKYIKPEYQREDSIKVPLIVDKNKNLITLNLPNSVKTMQISIPTPTENCQPINSGYVRTSVDNLNWIREPEDIARDQLKRASLAGKSPIFNFYFVGRLAKTIVIETTNNDACLLMGLSSELEYLKY